LTFSPSTRSASALGGLQEPAEGDDALADCEVACTGCARCAMDAPEGLIQIKNNLARLLITRRTTSPRRFPIQTLPDRRDRLARGKMVMRPRGRREENYPQGIPIPDKSDF
jgi:hypothetical protein